MDCIRIHLTSIYQRNEGSFECEWFLEVQMGLYA